MVYSPVRLFAEGVAACLDAQVDSRASACCRYDALHDAVAKREANVVLIDVTDRGALARCH